MRQRNAALVDGNGLRLGLFGANCSSGRTYATLPERWQASWENNLRLAQSLRPAPPTEIPRPGA